MISLTTEYAMRAAVCLASAEGEWLPGHEIAQQTGVPAGYLPKVLAALSAAGLVCARKGPQGGYRLTRPADQITLLDIEHAAQRVAVAPEWPSVTCGSCVGNRLRTFLGETHSSVESALAGVFLADMAGAPDRDTPALG